MHGKNHGITKKGHFHWKIIEFCFSYPHFFSISEYILQNLFFVTCVLFFCVSIYWSIVCKAGPISKQKWVNIRVCWPLPLFSCWRLFSTTATFVNHTQLSSQSNIIRCIENILTIYCSEQLTAPSFWPAPMAHSYRLELVTWYIHRSDIILSSWLCIYSAPNCSKAWSVQCYLRYFTLYRALKDKSRAYSRLRASFCRDIVKTKGIYICVFDNRVLMQG